MKKPLNRTGKVGVGSQRIVEGSAGICSFELFWSLWRGMPCNDFSQPKTNMNLVTEPERIQTQSVQTLVRLKQQIVGSARRPFSDVHSQCGPPPQVLSWLKTKQPQLVVYGSVLKPRIDGFSPLSMEYMRIIANPFIIISQTNICLVMIFANLGLSTVIISPLPAPCLRYGRGLPMDDHPAAMKKNTQAICVDFASVWGLTL